MAKKAFPCPQCRKLSKNKHEPIGQPTLLICSDPECDHRWFEIQGEGISEADREKVYYRGNRT